MRLDNEEESSNFEVQSGGSGGGFSVPGGGIGIPLGSGRMGCGMLVVLVILAMVMGINPLQLIGGMGGMSGGSPTVQTSQDADQLTEAQHFSLKVLGSTERTWAQLFSKEGQQYRPTTLVFYSGNGMSGCGAAQSAMGPFYCPTDQKVYLDTGFFDELRSRFGAPGDFAQAYVIAHEVGHHVQYLTGVADQVRKAQSRASEREGNQLQVAMELQADCYAGVWAKNDPDLQIDAGDVEEGMRAAHQIGDDVLQKQSQGYVVEAAFTHGSAEQRMAWLKRGLESGDPRVCDTFGQQ